MREREREREGRVGIESCELGGVGGGPKEAKEGTLGLRYHTLTMHSRVSERRAWHGTKNRERERKSLPEQQGV